MRLVKKESLGNIDVYDISVDEVQHYILENGLVTHNTGSYYSSNDIWIIGRSQEKQDGEVSGFNFNINIEKSRSIREKSKFSLRVTFEEGIDKFSGLLELGLESGLIQKPSQGWYQKVDPSTGELIGQKYREKDTRTEEFWKDILNTQEFKDFVSNKYIT